MSWHAEQVMVQMHALKGTIIVWVLHSYIYSSKGRTGFPWIDAIMTQLRIEGWIHQLARYSVACFLTRGDLWINWEEGMRVRMG